MAAKCCFRVLACLIACAVPTGRVGANQAQKADLQQLIEATKSNDEAAQVSAIHELGKQGPDAVAPLTGLLKNNSPIVRAFAARALGDIGPPAKSAAEPLIALLADTDQNVRRQALGALVSIHPGPAVTVPLFVKLMQDSDPGVRMRVMQAVADAKATAVPALIEALNNDKAAYWACLILRDIGPDAKAAVPALEKKLADSQPAIRREATLALAAIGAPEAAPRLVPLLKDEAAQLAATYALGVLGKIPPEAEPILRENADSSKPILSATSLWTLARVHPDDVELKRRTVAQLVEQLKDKDPFVRTAAARALASLPSTPEISGPIFERALASSDQVTTHHMIDALVGLGPAAVPKLINALQYKPLRAQVAATLGRFGAAAAPATPALAKLLSDEDPNVAIEAAYALAKIGPTAKAAVPELIAALKPAEERPAHAAAFALGMMGQNAAAAVPALTEIARRPSGSLSVIASWALVNIRGASAETAATITPALVAGLSSPHAETRRLAVETLGSLKSHAKGALAQLERATKDSDETVRAAAERAIAAIRG